MIQIILSCMLIVIPAPDWLNEDGSINTDALIAYLNDPNRVPPAPPSNVNVVVDMPILAQWLRQSATTIQILPEETPSSVVWQEGEEGTWEPVAPDQFFTQHKYTRAVYKRGNITDEVVGEFVIHRTTTKTPPCDTTKDGIVNFHDFALWAANWKGE